MKASRDEVVTFGRWLKLRRRARGLTQEDLARLTNYATKTVQAWEQDTVVPSVEAAAALAVHLRIPLTLQARFVAAARGQAGVDALPPPDDQVAHDLATDLVGRATDLSVLTALLTQRGVRLITLVGPGGVGKTRLALALTERGLRHFPDGAYFVELAKVMHPDLVLPTLAQALGCREAPSQSPLEALLATVHGKRILLVLDNFEHLMSTATTVADLLNAAPLLKIVITSRQVLALSGERPVPVQPLPVPQLDPTPTFDRIRASPAVQLFVQRAKQRQPHFWLQPENASAVGAICARLDGLPLAIELAASYISVMSPQRLLAHLTQALPVLEGGVSGLPERQQTMRATIQWSYDLLNEEDQAAMRGLSVFVGGFTEEMAAAALYNSTTTIEAARSTRTLLDKSLLQSEPLLDQQGTIRLRMLETIREYAAEKLVDSGEEVLRRQRHADYCLRLALAAQPELTGTSQAMWLRALALDRENFRAALEWWLTEEKGADPEAGLRLVAALWRFWYLDGSFREGRRWLDVALACSQHLTDADSGETILIEAKALALRGAGVLADAQNDADAARRCFAESLALYRRLNDEAGVGASLDSLALVEIYQGNYEAAEPLLWESLAVFERIGPLRAVARCLVHLGMVDEQRGDYAAARELYARSLTLFEEIHDARGIAIGLSNMGNMAHYAGDFAEAGDYYRRSLTQAQALNDRWLMARLLHYLASLAVAEQRQARAASLFGAADALRQVIGSPVPEGEQAAYRQEMRQVKRQLGSLEWQSLWSAGQRMTLDEAVAFALETPPP